MVFLRILAFFYMVFWVANIARSLLGSAPKSGPGDGGQRRRRPNFDANGPFGPFGPQAPPRSQYQSARQSAYEAPPPRPPPRPAPKSAHSILGISLGASSDEVRRAYQSLVRQYHPDLTAKLAPELRELAEARTKEITNAYNQLKRGG